MRLHHIRNATFVLELGSRLILVDPMFAAAGTMPSFKLFGGGTRNPTVGLPDGSRDAFEQVESVLITHEHPDHLDPDALSWVQAKELPVVAAEVDAPNLRKKGLQVEMARDSVMEIPAEVVPATHGRGPLAFMMGPVSGYYLAHPDEPSIYITGDTVLTDTVREAIERLRPDVIVAPAGSANFGVGGEVIFPPAELVELARLAPGEVVFNHLEALDHCPTTRAELRDLLADADVGGRAHIPQDGESLCFDRASDSASPVAPRRVDNRKPGLQKWLTSPLTGT